jgi:hypothetical protein
MKTFKQLREALNPEAAALKPRAQGEQDFVDMHKPTVTDYPTKRDSFETDDKIAKTKHQPGNGDRGPIQQGTSKLGDKSGFKGQQTPKRIADSARQGDLKVLKTSASAASAPAFVESVFNNQPMISESDDDSIYIELDNGDSVEVNEDTYNAIVDMFNKLNAENQSVFRSAINESADSFEKILDFIAKAYEEAN